MKTRTLPLLEHKTDAGKAGRSSARRRTTRAGRILVFSHTPQPAPAESTMPARFLNLTNIAPAAIGGYNIAYAAAWLLCAENSPP